jgi:YVTN family beta-propeller protein
MSKFSQQFIRAHHRAQASLAPTVTAGMVTALVSGLALGLAGCGSNLRPTTTPIVGTGPGSQPPSNAFVISKPSPSAQGVGTVIDYSGDTISATAPIGPGPVTFALSSGGNTAWTLNVDGTVSNIPVSSNLQNKNVTYSTLAPIPTTGPYANLDPVVSLFSGSLGLYALDVNTNNVDVLTGSPDAFKLVVPVDETPVTMIGISGSTRYYSISQLIPYGTACNTNPSGVGVNGVADGIETSFYTVSSHIPVGVCPVYAVGTPDTKRIFVLNRGSDTVSVINSQNNTIDACTPGINQNGQPYTCHPSLPLTPAAGLAHAGPVYAEYNQTTGQLVVSNYDGNTISIIDVSLDEYGNDSSTFGTTFTVPVGKNPAAVTVLADGSRAYVANQSDGTISIVNLISHTVEKTLPVQGHPRTVVSTQNSLYGKVYVASPDSPYISIIRTDQDILSTTVLVQGNAVDVRTTSPDATNANLNTVSRLPGAGQPCYLPVSAFTAAGAPVTIANCQTQDPTLFTTAP